MEAGALDRRVTIQKRSIVSTVNGYPQETWTDLMIRPARKITTGGREFYAAQRLNAETTAVFVLRFTRAITRDMRIKDGNQIFEIIAPPNDVDGRRVELQIIAKELV